MEKIAGKNLEKLLKALANQRRLAILLHLKHNNSDTVGGIAGAIKLSFKATSKHIAILANADLIEKEQTSLLVSCWLSRNLHFLARKVLEYL